MTESQIILLSVIALLQAKHLVFDFLLQSGYQVENKGTYAHPGGILHSGGHMIGSVPAALLAGTGILPLLVILICEFVVHYHIDWAKAQITIRNGWTPRDNAFWYGIGVDQALHQATYLVMAPLFIIYATI